MPVARSNGIEVAYETFGRASDPAVLLVNGFSSQLLGWDEKLCHLLATKGYRVIRFDNRDVGLTSKTDGSPPDVMALFEARLAGQPTPAPPYTLSDMAADGIDLLSALGLDRAHVVGMSMGGMIVQLMAIEHPDRVRSMTSIMSTTGNPAVGTASPEALGALATPPPTERDPYIEHQVNLWRIISGPLYDPTYRRERAGLTYDRMFWPTGAAFQLAAIIGAHDRTEQLGQLDLPALVIHGRADPLVTLSGGEATAEAIPHAKLVVYNDMGHDLPPPLFQDYVSDVITVMRRAD
jgi:pimeloyl-ACP methyl ester carboxylesterase